MEAGLRTRRIREVDRTWRLYRGLDEVAEVAFLRAGSHGRALCLFLTPHPHRHKCIPRKDGVFPGKMVYSPDGLEKEHTFV